MNGRAMEQFMMIQAARFTLLARTDDIQNYARKWKLHRHVRDAASMLKTFVDRVSVHLTVEQLCSMQNMSEESFVQLKSYGGDGTAVVGAHDLVELVSMARLHNYMQADTPRCDNCMRCMSRAEWQTCPMYGLLGRIPIATPEHYDDPNICPYSVGK